MEFGLKHLIVVVLLAALAWWVTIKLPLPTLVKQIVEVAIVVIVALVALELIFGTLPG